MRLGGEREKTKKRKTLLICNLLSSSELLQGNQADVDVS